MTAWGVVAVCGIGGGVAGPFLDVLARRVRRPVVAESLAPAAAVSFPGDPGSGDPGSGDPGSGDPAAARSAADAHPGLPALAVARASRRAAVAEGGTVAVVTAAAFALDAVRLGAVPQLAAYCVLAGALMVLSVTDVRTGLVPRRIVYAAGLAVGVALLCASAADGSWHPMLDALAGAAAGLVLLGGIWLVSPKAMGFGDVRLAGLCGGALGWVGLSALYVGFLAAFVAGALVGLVLLVARGRHRLPFAPALALGTMFGVLWGTWLGNLWLHRW
jgi:leader peptidase (prepilin peptidase)/N-methyltransferase